MTDKILAPQNLRIRLYILAAILFFLFLSVSLLAEQKTPTLPTDCFPLDIDAQALLPLIPSSTPLSHTALPLGMAPGIMGPLPGEPPPDPDDAKTLYGYSGPYYNTNSLDGRVMVLDQSVYAWPLSTWKASGMFRNQTRCPVAIHAISAQLLGSSGEVIATSSASIPVDNLRPGEPGPFVIEAPVARGEVKSILWHIDFTPAPPSLRLFDFEVGEDRLSSGGSRYDLGGTIRNAASITAREVRVVAAWLDDRGKVLYVSATKLRNVSNPMDDRDAIDLKSDERGVFVFITKNPSIAPILGNTSPTLWGIAQ